MPVFKLCLHIYKKNIGIMMIYFGVFLGISLIVVSATKSNVEKGFRQTKTSIAIITKDDSPLIDGLKESMSQVANFVEIQDEESAIQDALYFRKVVYILRIPENYTEKFMNGESVLIDRITIPNSIDAIYLNLQINQYLRLAKLYMIGDNTNLTDITQKVLNDMSLSAKVEMAASDNNGSDQSYSVYYFNYMGYGLFAILILGISTILLVFNKVDIRRRNSCSPITIGSRNLQLLLANLAFSIICWVIFVSVCVMLNAKNMFSVNVLLFLLNSLLFTLCAASISFLIGMLVKNREAISALSNVIALGSSFISGVFVPQSLLSAYVLKLASFTPTYWYVRSNNLIAQMSVISSKHLSELFGYMGVIVGFTLAFVALALVVGKQKQLSEQV